MFPVSWKEISLPGSRQTARALARQQQGLELGVRPKAHLAGARRDRACLQQKIGAVIHDADVVSGGYCQHTEGFGEMAEEENRRRVGQQISNIQFLPFLLSRSASPSYEARTRIPPAPPVAHLSRPVVADDDQPRRRPARVTRSSTHVMPKTVAALTTSSSDASWSSLPLSSLFSSSPLLPS
jgi:hypothetical protein